MSKQRPDYVSDHTLFIEQWLQRHPEQETVRKSGRALWWDKPQDPESLRKAMEDFERRKTPRV